MAVNGPSVSKNIVNPDDFILPWPTIANLFNSVMKQDPILASMTYKIRWQQLK